MASLLAKSLATNPLIRAVVMFRPTVGSSARFFSSKFRLDDSDEFKCKLKPPTDCDSEALNVVNEAFCPQISATRNMARILNLMDNSVGVIAAASGCPRWDVMQDAKALYIVRDMSGLPRKDEIFREEPTPEHRLVFGCVRVLHFGCTLTLVVGKNGPDPGAAYEGYRVRMWLPSRYNSTWDIKMGVMNEVLTIIVPKEIKGKWIHRFTMIPDFFLPEP